MDCINAELEQGPEDKPIFSGWLLKVVCHNHRLTEQQSFRNYTYIA
jgi:hypothetical protein